MKALVILIPTDFYSKEVEKSCIEECVETIYQDIESSDEGTINVHVIDEEEIAKLLVNKADSIPEKKDTVEEYCEFIRALFGETDEVMFKRMLVSAIATNNKIILNHPAIKILTGNKKLSTKQLQILSKHNMVKLPSILKEINTLIQFI